MDTGVRSVDNMRSYVFPPGTPEDILEAEADKFEVEIVNSANKAKEQGKHGIIYLPGSKEILDVVQTPGAKWAICTSAATRTYASAALKTVDLPLPAVFVTAGDVSKGKPWPEPYLLGAAKCGVDPSECESPTFDSFDVFRVVEVGCGGERSGVCVVRGENTTEQNKGSATLFEFCRIRCSLASSNTPCQAQELTFSIGVVFEDAPSGIRSGKAAGSKVYVSLAAPPAYITRLNPSCALDFSHARSSRVGRGRRDRPESLTGDGDVGWGEIHIGDRLDFVDWIS
ncbi:Hydrolase domain-containing protein [Rhizoctonia solani AG-1 IA]|uniref:Hydrolase domain-containing protein n=1 Tax=Thanatephorus cucumeris (strain AG1-IA) TaxID=983506 RepID=L8WLN3_THACA|nr:Hydrolase domain-containing protein [Rhizoctonia solani AG-1 IA]